jgi:hypothetical protein
MPRMLLALALWFTLVPTTPALVRIDDESIKMAIKYGLANQGLGHATLLGPNWKEGEQGALLNIYSPFMLLASQASKSGQPRKPTEEEYQKAKAYCRRVLRDFRDTHRPLQIKFALSLYGTAPEFAGSTRAWIEGFRGGRDVVIKPMRDFRQAEAKPHDNGVFEAVNAYYFKFEDLAPMEEYRLIVQTPTGEPITFRIRNKDIY